MILCSWQNANASNWQSAADYWFSKKIISLLLIWLEKLISWKGKHFTLLQSTSIYLLSAIELSKYVLNQLHWPFTCFFWNNNLEVLARHWWFPYATFEGGMGSKSLFWYIECLDCGASLWLIDVVGVVILSWFGKPKQSERQIQDFNLMSSKFRFLQLNLLLFW